MKEQDRYAYGTKVTIAKSEREMRRLFDRYGAQRVQWAVEYYDGKNAVICRVVVKDVPLQFAIEWSDDRWSAAESRRKWRVLCLTTKARFEEVEAGAPVSVAFMGNVILPDGETMGSKFGPALEEGGALPQLPALGSPA